MGFPCGSADKESACSAGDLGSIPGLGRSPGEGKGYPLQYSGLENSMDCIVHAVTKSWTRLSRLSLSHTYILVCNYSFLSNGQKLWTVVIMQMWFLEEKAEDTFTFHFISLNCYIWLHILILYLTLYFIDSGGFPGGSVSKESSCNAGDSGAIPGSGRSPEDRNDNPHQYACLGNPVDRGAWWVTVHGIARVGLSD